MRAEELRINNLILANGLHEGKIMTVEQIGSRGTLQDDVRVISFKEHHVGEFVKDCLGVPLTEEWLIKFGFEKKHDNTTNAEFYDNDAISVYYTDHVFTAYIGGKDWDNEYPIKVISVHQLQNLYFALTGNELTIKQ